MKPQDAKRLQQVTMYVSHEEYECIKVVAAKDGISQYLKQLVIRDFEKLGENWPGQSVHQGQRRKDAP